MEIKLTRIEIFVFRAPIDIPVRTSFGVMVDRPAVLMRVEDGQGAHGWKEIWCNFPTCGAEHRARLAETVVAPLIIGRSFAKPDDGLTWLEEKTGVLAIQTAEYGPLGLAQPFPSLENGSFVLSEAPGLGVEPVLAEVDQFIVMRREVH